MMPDPQEDPQTLKELFEPQEDEFADEWEDNAVATAEFGDEEDEETEEKPDETTAEERDSIEEEKPEEEEEEEKTEETVADQEEGEDKPEEKSEEQEDVPLLDQVVTYQAAGEERQKTVADLVKDSQRALGAEKAHQEAVEQQKVATQIIESIKSDPFEAGVRLLIREGVDEEMARDLMNRKAAQRVEVALQEAQLPDEERQRRLLERQIEKKRQELADAEAEIQRKNQEAQHKRLADEMKLGAKSVGLQQDAVTYQGITAVYFAAQRSGSPISMEEAARTYKAKLDEYVATTHLKALPPDELARLSPETAAKLSEKGRKDRIEKAKKTRSEKRGVSTPQRARRQKTFKSFEEAKRDAQRRDRQLL